MDVSRLRSHRSAELILWALLGLYAALVLWMAVSVSYFFVRKAAIVPVFCVAALLSSRLAPFLRDWVPFLGWTLVFDALRGLIFAVITRFDLPVFMAYAISMERALLGGAILPVVLQRAWLDGTSVGWIERIAVIVHASHFVLFLTVGLFIWYRRPEYFKRYAAAMIAVMFLGLVVYLVVPTVPPWMAAREFAVLPPIDRVGMWIYNVNMPRLTNALATNPVAAMPSLHAAFPAACAAIAIHLFGWRAAWMVAYTVAVAIVVAYLGEHYLIDVLAGWILAIGVYLVIFRTSLWRQGGARSPSLARAIAAGAILFAASEGFSALKSRVERPFVPTRAFIERELAGRSPAESFFRGLRAERDGDLPGARRYFAAATDAATGEEQRREAIRARLRVTPGADDGILRVE